MTASSLLAAALPPAVDDAVVGVSFSFFEMSVLVQGVVRVLRFVVGVVVVVAAEVPASRDVIAPPSSSTTGVVASILFHR